MGKCKEMEPSTVTIIIASLLLVVHALVIILGTVDISRDKDFTLTQIFGWIALAMNIAAVAVSLLKTQIEYIADNGLRFTTMLGDCFVKLVFLILLATKIAAPAGPASAVVYGSCVLFAHSINLIVLATKGETAYNSMKQ